MKYQKTDRRVQRTTQLLQDALVDLMMEKTYEKITIQDIIDQANIGRATFYNHYQDKDDLMLRGVAEIAYGDDLEEVIGENTDDPRQVTSLDAISTRNMFEHVKNNNRLHQVMFKKNKANPILEKGTAFLYANIMKQLESLVVEDHEPAVPTPILAHFITGGLMSLIQWWQDNNLPYSPAEMDTIVQKIIMPGVLEVVKN